MTLKDRATVADLCRVKGKAELIDGKIVLMSPTGRRPGYAGDAILVSLWQHARRTRSGIAVGDNKGFRVDLPGRETLSPDAAYYVGGDSGMRFYEGAPIFAAEVRSEGDYGPQAERELAAKRADYFAAGTLVVWDVDLQDEAVVRSYRSESPEVPLLFGRGETAQAEPAVPGWTLPVDELFE